MFTWFTLIKGLVSLAGKLAKFMADRQLIQAGEAKAIAENLDATLDKIRKADTARHNVKHDADSVRNDPNNRDN